MTPPAKQALVGAKRFIGVLAVALPLAAQQDSVPVTETRRTCSIATDMAGASAPFRIGEKLSYSISFGPIRVGRGSMELTAGDTVRGRTAYHAAFRMHGGTFFFRVNDEVDSWFDQLTFASLRFTQNIHEGGYRANRLYEIYPERAEYVERGDTAKQSVSQPLDDASFFYFLRSVPLTVGSVYECNRYFQPEANPVVIRVVRAERVEVPAGTFDAVVLQPLIKTEGIFSQKGRAEVWIRADGAHELLQIKSHLVFGSINLYLSEISSSSAPAP
jgi:hypothetical protein